MWLWFFGSMEVVSEGDYCICFTQKIQQGGDWERSRPQGPKNVHNFLMTVRPLSWACEHGTEMLLILKKLFSPWLWPDFFRYDSPKKCPTILYAVNLWLKPVPATGASLQCRIFRCLSLSNTVVFLVTLISRCLSRSDHHMYMIKIEIIWRESHVYEISVQSWISLWFFKGLVIPY